MATIPTETDAVLEKIAKEDFEPLVGQTIDVCVAGASQPLEVKEVRAIHNPTPRAVPPFALVLRSRDNWRASQGMYRLAHPRLGMVEVFFVPIGPDGTGLCYEAIFN
jgi:hypothetical protein